MNRLEELRGKARELVELNAQLAIAAPEFEAGAAWLNTSRPLSLGEDLRGKVVLIDFWTFCCINCLHVLEDLAWLEQRFAGRPFVVVGCHSAKFANEADAAQIRQAVLREGIEHPVVIDPEFAIWRQYGVQAWPTLFLLGPDGCVLGQLSGEGQRSVLEALVEAALELYERRGLLDPRPLPLRAEREAQLARELCFPGKLAVDPLRRELAIADTGHHRLVFTTLDGRFLRSIGSGEPGLIDGAAESACFRAPRGLAFHGKQLFVADTGNHALRVVELVGGRVRTLAGDGHQGLAQSGPRGFAQARLNSPWDLALDGSTLWIAMAGPHQIWCARLEEQVLEPIFGDGHERRLDGPAPRAGFAQPSGLARDGAWLYVADSESSSIRVLDTHGGSVSTLAGGAENPLDLFHFGDEDGAGLGRRFQHPLAVAVDAEHVYVADSYNHKLKRVDRSSGRVETLAGSGDVGHQDDRGREARLYEPGGLALVEQDLFVADTNNHAVRVVDLATGEVRTLALDSVPIPPRALRRGASSIDAGPLPWLPGTLDHGTLAVELASGDATLVLDLALPAGSGLAQGAPSQYRVLHDFGLVAAKSVAGRITNARTEIALGVLGSGRLLVQLLWYACDHQAQCKVESARWTLDVTAGGEGRRVVELAPRRG